MLTKVKIARKAEFKPVKITIVCQTIEELQEVQARFELSGNELESVHPIFETDTGTTYLKGITKFRDRLCVMLGKHSITRVGEDW